MDPVELRKAIAVLNGHWAGREAPPDVHVAEFGTDSRTLSGTGVFVALRGERTDGHAHVAEARRRGALASVVSRGALPDLPTDGGPYIAVEDPLTALERLGAWNRERLDLSVVGITGSVGKTSTKGFLGAVLSSKYNVRVAPKSFNNRLGVALTLLSAAACDDILVAELGTSGPGELSHLSGLVRPQRIVLTEIGAAHLQGLKDLDGVVEAKAEVLDGLDADGTLFLRHGVYGHERFCELSARPPITFGWAPGECPGSADRSQPDLAVSSCASVSLDRTGANPAAYGYRFTVNDAEDLVLPVPGRHNVLNAAAAIAVARDLGMDWQEIRSSLLSCRLPPQRVQIFEIGGVVVMDDSYNANPGSMEAAISEWQTLARPDRTQGGSVRVAVLGDMLELGKDSRQHHEAVGRHLAASDARVVVTVGDESRWIQDGYRASGGDAETAHFPSVEPALPYLRGVIQKGDRVLFKASRAIGLDRIVAELRGALAPRETEGSYGGAGSTCSLS